MWVWVFECRSQVPNLFHFLAVSKGHSWLVTNEHGLDSERGRAYLEFEKEESSKKIKRNELWRYFVADRKGRLLRTGKVEKSSVGEKIPPVTLRATPMCV
jgi:hypothetical protein